MKHRLFLLFPIFAFLGAILFTSCTKETIVGSVPGDIIGSVQVYDTNYVAMTDNSGVKVSIEGTPYSAFSDASGKWHLTNISAGTYTLVFSKDGYATMKQQNFQFTGNGTLLYDLYLQYVVHSAIPQIFTIPNLYPNIVLRPFDSTSALFSSRAVYPNHNVPTSSILLLGKTAQLDPEVPNSYAILIGTYLTGDTTRMIDFSIEKRDLLKAGFSSNDVIYCCAFATTYYIASNNFTNWYDLTTGKTVYSGFSPHHSEVKSFILP